MKPLPKSGRLISSSLGQHNQTQSSLVEKFMVAQLLFWQRDRQGYRIESLPLILIRRELDRCETKPMSSWR
jgi:hypothetical protein